MTRLLFVRHGKAVSNETGTIAGLASCTGLSDLGRSQAELLRDRLLAHPVPVDVVLTSLLPRAVETAQIIAPAIGPVVMQDCDLCELHPGECDGMTWTEWAERYGFDPMAELDRELSPGGESVLTFARRVIATIERIVAEHAGRTVALVVHGGVISVATLHLLGFDESALHEKRSIWMEPENTSLTEWRLDDKGRWHMVRFNDSSHLETRPAESGAPDVPLP